ncbi:MAG: nuclear transport factor 2 family protein [Acidobacteriia bacterium]|nr:nuclear transport factor 2 family protein [Terriglobia bacterium]
MRRFVTYGLIIGVVCATAFAALAAKPVAAAEDEMVLFQADQSLAQALGKADKAAVGALLDENFEWTDTDGKTWTRAQVLQNLAKFKIESEADWTHAYPHVGVVLNIHHSPRFAHIWVKRPAGWRAFVYLDTPIPVSPATPVPLRHYDANAVCNNPCKTLPFKPTTTIDQTIITTWLKGKVAEWHPDPDIWTVPTGDEFLIINDLPRLKDGIASKAERVAQLVKAKLRGGIGVPGDPVTSMRMTDFSGDGAVVISHHVPRDGGKPYYNVRVWVYRNGGWQIVISQQTTIKNAPPVDAKSTLPM